MSSNLVLYKKKLNRTSTRSRKKVDKEFSNWLKNKDLEVECIFQRIKVKENTSVN